jgi:hypothetical protein
MDLNEKVINIFKNLKPRDPERISPFLEEIGNEWRKRSDLRFGQIMYNFFSDYGDVFNLEEKAFLAEFKKYMSKNDYISPPVRENE